MCLIPRSKEFEPYNKSRVRWKHLSTFHDKLLSAIQGDRWHVGSEKRAINGRSADALHRDIGIHVFVTKRDAVRYSAGVGVVAKLEVSSFNSSGSFGNYQCETWKRARLVKVYSPSSRTDITRKFKK